MTAMTEPAPTIHVVDDDPSIRRALSRLLRCKGYACETWETAEDFLTRPPARAPGCAIVDLELPGASGLDLQAKLGDTVSALPVIFLSGRGDIGASVRAMKAGAVDFLTKPVEAEPLLAAISTALARSRATQAERAAVADRDARLAALTPREREVLEMVVEGRLNKQIAGELGIAEKTIKVHRGRVMHKLGVRTVADLVRFVVAPRE